MHPIQNTSDLYNEIQWNEFTSSENQENMLNSLKFKYGG